VNLNYTTGIPNAPNNPSSDQPLMQTNTTSIDTWVQQDHIGFNTNNGGYHSTIHAQQQGTWDPVARTGAPASVTGFQEIFSLLYTPNTTGGAQDTQLFTQTGNGGVSQLSGNLAPGANLSDGWVWVGGLLVQWGYEDIDFSAGGSITGSVTFKDRVTGAIPFPKYCYGVWTNLLVTFSSLPSSSGSVNIRQSSLSNTGFHYQFISNSHDYTLGFTWVAIGQ